MPKSRGDQWRAGRKALRLTSAQVATLLGIKPGSLRSIELELQPVSESLACRAALLYKCDPNLLIRADEVPDPPPGKDQKDETNRGPGREGSGGTGPGKAGKTSPKRVKGVAA